MALARLDTELCIINKFFLSLNKIYRRNIYDVVDILFCSLSLLNLRLKIINQ